MTREEVEHLARTKALTPEQRAVLSDYIKNWYTPLDGVGPIPELSAYEPPAKSWLALFRRRWSEGFMIAFVAGFAIGMAALAGAAGGGVVSLVWSLIRPADEGVMESAGWIIAIAMAPFFLGFFMEITKITTRSANGSLYMAPKRTE